MLDGDLPRQHSQVDGWLKGLKSNLQASQMEYVLHRSCNWRAAQLSHCEARRGQDEEIRKLRGEIIRFTTNILPVCVCVCVAFAHIQPLMFWIAH